MKRQRKDYWVPRAGSWEEAVDPYEVQCMRCKSTTTEMRMKSVAIDAQQDQQMQSTRMRSLSM